MYEMLLASITANPIPDYPDSGPGQTKLIKGNSDIGYFGFVSSTELLSYAAYRSNLTSESWKLGTDKGWLKFAYKKKVIFVSFNYMFQEVAWSKLYSAGGIYGVDGPGSFPYPASSPKNQYKPITLNARGEDYILIPRTLGVVAIDPSPYGTYSVGSEIMNLMGRVCGTDLFKDSHYGEFAKYTQIELGMNAVHMGFESEEKSTGNALILGYPNGTSWSTGVLRLSKEDARGYYQVFRAVLELKDYTLD